MGLIAWYRLDGDAQDWLSGQDGVASNVTWVDGKLGKAGDFTRGAGNGIWIPHDDHLSSRVFGVGTTLSFSFWIYPRQYRDYGIVIGKQSGYSYSNSTSSVWINRWGIRFQLGTNESGNPSGSSAALTRSPPLNQWHHIACVADGERMYYYLNGELATSGPITLSRPRSENTNDIQIGTPRVRGGNEGCDAVIQDVRIYDHALSPREVRDLSLAPAVQELSAELDNTADAGNTLTVSDSPAVLGDTSIAFWIYPTTTSRRQTVWDNGYGGEGTINFETDGRLNFYSGPNGDNSSGYTNSVRSSVLPLNSWSHVVAVRDMASQEWRWFINGEPDVFSSHTLTSIGETTFDLQVGTGYTSDFIGKMRDVKQFASVLTPAQVKELYQQRASIDRGGSVNVGQVVEHLEGGGGLPVVVNSSGKDDGDQSWIYVDSINYSYRRRGHNIVVLAPNGKVVSQANFDTHSWLRYRIDAASSTVTETWQETEDVMLAYLEAIPEGHYVAFSVHDQGQHSRSSVHAALAGLGFRRHVIGFRDGWAALCRKGSWAIEDVSARFSGYEAEVRQSVVASPAAHDQGFRAPDLSEVGPARGLVAWYPLVSDTLDYAGVNHAVNNGAVLTAEGYAFESSTYLHAAAPVLPSSGDGVEATMSAWIKPGNFSGEGWIVSQYASGGALRFIWNTTSSGRMRYFIGGSSITGTAALATNTWVHVCVTRKADGAIDLFLNGQPDGSGTLTDLYADTPLTIGNSAGDSGASLAIRDVRIHNVALSPEEVALLYNMTRPDGSKTAFTENCMYTRGQIKEVIA